MKYLIFWLILSFPFLICGETIETYECNGNTIIIIKNDKDMLVKTEVRDNTDNTLFFQEIKYNDSECPIQLIDKFEHNGVIENQITKISYNEQNRPISFIRGYGSENERKIVCEYNQDGDIILQIKPNGVKIYYEYNSSECFFNIYSSDNSINYKAYYNEDEDIFKFEDCINGATIYRITDDDENIVRELFPNGKEILINYNCDDKPSSIKITDHGEIQYEYENNDGNLLQVKRFSSLNKLLYSHNYQ